ncbi:MAG: molybdopterin molybdenumtransferase MoeA, partial [Cyanothece sp. SIO1E1]|nr:molybdopterin molybdenumtransferase MoeA [Cyanothece sp. SIO1E1]
NQYALAALVTQAGADPLCLGIVPDAPDALKRAIAQAITSADMVLSSGGVSVGDYDYVDQILAELGAEIHIRAVAVKPGKPLTVATFVPQESGGMGEPGKPGKIGEPGRQGERLSVMPVLYFGLPGNPVSALVSCWRFVVPALRKLAGLPRPWRPVFVEARSRHELRAGGKRETYLWGQLHWADAGYEFSLAGGSHSSGNLINLAQTNALAVVPIGQTRIPAGAQVQVMQVR